MLRRAASAFATFVAFVMLAALATLAAAADSGRVPKPVIEIANPGQCIDSPEVMRRTHMDLLKHQRDKTMHEGERRAKASLNGCIECHASKSSGSVQGTNQNFCQGCHSYTAVKLDCFECHQPKLAKTAARIAGAKP